MSNRIYVQFTRFQNIDEHGNPTGETSLGYRLYDDYEQTYDNSFESVEEMQNEGLNPENVCEYICNHHDGFDESIREHGLYLNDEHCEYHETNSEEE